MTSRYTAATRTITSTAKPVLAVIAIAAALLVAACGSSREAASDKQKTKKYERKPIVETTDGKLRIESMMIQAKMDQELGNSGGAMTTYGSILEQDPDNSAASYELSRLLANAGMTDSAIVCARRAVVGNTNVWYKLHLASLYRYANRKDDLIKVWESIVKENPQRLEYYYELSNAYLLNNKTREAIEALNRVEKMIGVTEEVSMQKAKLWSYAGNEDKALAEIEKMAEAMPQESKYDGMLAERYMKSGKYAQAKRHYDRIAANNPDDEYIHISLAEYYKTTGEAKKAYEELQKGFRQKNLSTTNKIQILTNFYSGEEFYGTYSQYAFNLLEIIMQECDDSVRYAGFYGDVLMRQRRFGEAARQLELYLTIDSSKYDIWEALLVCDLESGADSTTLENHAVRAQKLFPLHSMPYFISALNAFAKNDYARVIELGKRCEQLGFTNRAIEADCYATMAESYSQLDDRRCLTYYEKLLQLMPDDNTALNNYAYKLALYGTDLEKAERMSRRTLESAPDVAIYLDTYGWIMHMMGRDDEAVKYLRKAVEKGGDKTVQEHLREVER